MNVIIEKITGKNASPAKRYTAYAALITAAVLFVALCVLVVSSIVFAVSDDGTDNVPSGDNIGGDNDSSGGVVSSSAVQYEAVTADKLKPNTVSVQEKRSKLSGSGLGDNDMYYGAYKNVKLASEAQTSLDSMLVAFYNAKKTELKTNTKNSDCNIPCIKTSDSYDSFTFDIVIYTEEKTIYSTDKSSIYAWIYSNASNYGFIYGSESNKFTYVGVAIAKYMTSNKITSLDKLAETLNGKNNVSVQAAVAGATKATTYQIYYLASNAAELKVPTNYGYSVIANGTSGYFIVINMSEKIASATNNSLS